MGGEVQERRIWMPSTSTLNAVGYSFGFIFTLWPLLVLSPLKWNKGNLLASMIIVWTLMLFGWLFARSVSPKLPLLLIPEPLNTYLFFLTGLALLLWALLRATREERFVRATTQMARSATEKVDTTPEQLEMMAIELYRFLGYNVKRTGGKSVRGADLLVHGQNGKKWLVWCKSWRGPVGDETVRDMWERLQQEEADGGILVTTGPVSREARDWARGKPISLMEGEEFLSAWRQARNA